MAPTQAPNEAPSPSVHAADPPYHWYSPLGWAQVSLNGFTSVDAQLAAVLHSAAKVFASFPENRPDLPVSYFTKFLFSDEYMATVHPNLALNIYTAVANPLTVEGRVKMCRAVLAASNVAPAVGPAALPVPLVVLQTTENALVSRARTRGRERSVLRRWQDRGPALLVLKSNHERVSW